ncbi:hypothetical protein [Paraburkholderia sp. NMBU_R16]|uniref:hypothetical protein n=1 Tax=Paraburkholderia sp. NMBU_R16 TaxID=2698676 RepID=UPI0020B7EB98|nr:hypothetical protein [Paraburkholderia sp. NMBU_R16]
MSKFAARSTNELAQSRVITAPTADVQNALATQRALQHMRSRKNLFNGQQFSPEAQRVCTNSLEFNAPFRGVICSHPHIIHVNWILSDFTIFMMREFPCTTECKARHSDMEREAIAELLANAAIT